MPFLPFVLLLAWQALSRSASFALGWATALYFGQVPGRQGRILSVISLISAAWLILAIGFGVPIAVGEVLERTDLISRSFSVPPLYALGLIAGILLGPPIVAGMTVWGHFHDERSIGTFLRLIPISYPSTAMLGLAVLQMVAFTPVILVRRWRHKIKYVQVSLVMREGTDDDDLAEGIEEALASIGIEGVTSAEASGPKVWPLLTVGYASEHLLGAVVRGHPMRLAADGIEIYAYATNISIQGPKEDTYRVRAAIERKLGFHETYLTWNDEAQEIEDALLAAHEELGGDVERLRERLDEIQADMDTASVNSEEWNVLYRRRLQIELAARARDDERDAKAAGGSSSNGSRRRSDRRIRSTARPA